MKKRVSIFLVRHAKAKRGEKRDFPSKRLDLTFGGVKSTIKYGQKLSQKDAKMKFYSGSTQRALDTASISKRIVERKTSSDRVYKKLRIRRGIDSSVIDSAAWNKMFVEKYKGNNTLAMVSWLAGEVPTTICRSPNTIAEETIRKRLKIGTRLKSSNKKVDLLNFTNQTVMIAVFERLTRKKYFDTFYKQNESKIMPQALEEMRFDFTPKGKIVLTHRGKKFVVTSAIKQIISKK